MTISRSLTETKVIRGRAKVEAPGQVADAHKFLVCQNAL